MPLWRGQGNVFAVSRTQPNPEVPLLDTLCRISFQPPKTCSVHSVTNTLYPFVVIINGFPKLIAFMGLNCK
jgi:hypothetical protein